MSGSKASGALFVLAIITLICAGVIFIVTSESTVLRVVGIQKEIELTIISEDKGSALITLLELSADGSTGAEVLGNLVAEARELPPEIKTVLDETVTKLVVLNSSGGFLTMYKTDTNVQGFKFADIALPGAQPGFLKGRVGLR